MTDCFLRTLKTTHKTQVVFEGEETTLPPCCLFTASHIGNDPIQSIPPPNQHHSKKHKISIPPKKQRYSTTLHKQQAHLDPPTVSGCIHLMDPFPINSLARIQVIQPQLISYRVHHSKPLMQPPQPQTKMNLSSRSTLPESHHWAPDCNHIVLVTPSYQPVSQHQGISLNKSVQLKNLDIKSVKSEDGESRVTYKLQQSTVLVEYFKLGDVEKL